MPTLEELANAFRQAQSSPTYLSGLDMMAGRNPNEEAVKRAQAAQVTAQQKELERKNQADNAINAVHPFLRGKSPQEQFDILTQVGIPPAEAAKVVMDNVAIEEAGRPELVHNTVTGEWINKRSGQIFNPLPAGGNQPSPAPMYDGGEDVMQPLPEMGAVNTSGMSPRSRQAVEEARIELLKRQAVADQEKLQKEPQIRSQIQRVFNQIDSSKKLIEEVSSNVNAYTAGLGGTLISIIPGSPASDLQGQIETLLARTGFNELLQIKREGGTLGSTSGNEIALLQATAANLQQKQSPPQLKKNLQEYGRQLNVTKKAMADDYKAAYGKPLPPANNDGWSIKRLP